MRITYLPIVILLSGVFGSPAVLHPRDGGPNAFFCDGINFASPCGVAYFPLNTCFNVPANYTGKISSFQPSKGIACLLWKDRDCKGSNAGGYFVHPGSSDLRKQNFNDVTSSFQCKTA